MAERSLQWTHNDDKHNADSTMQLCEAPNSTEDDDTSEILTSVKQSLWEMYGFTFAHGKYLELST